MRKGNVDWQKFAESLLWQMIVMHKNDDSGFDIITAQNTEYSIPGYGVGDIGYWRILSYYIGDFKPLTWKELALELGLFTDRLTSDGHNCGICPEHENCKAYFKDDKDHERCNFWGMLMGKKLKTDDGLVYGQLPTDKSVGLTGD